jgi:hypothetical protein
MRGPEARGPDGWRGPDGRGGIARPRSAADARGPANGGGRWPDCPGWKGGIEGPGKRLPLGMFGGRWELPPRLGPGNMIGVMWLWCLWLRRGCLMCVG